MFNDVTVFVIDLLLLLFSEVLVLYGSLFPASNKKNVIATFYCKFIANLAILTFFIAIQTFFPNNCKFYLAILTSSEL